MIVAATTLAVAGDEIRLRYGTYTPLVAGTIPGAVATNGTATAGKGVYTLAINGAAGSQITIRNYPGEAVRINGAIHAVGGAASYLTVRGIEIAATPTTRSFANRAAVDFPGLYISAPGIDIDRNYIHDIAQVYIMGTGGCTVTQNVIGLSGMYLNDEGYTGYSIYTHNNAGGAVTIKKNIFLGAYNGYNLGCQSAGANAIMDYLVEYNLFFAGGVLWGSASGVDSGNVFSNNQIYTPTRPSAAYLYTYTMRSRGYDNTNPENWTVQNNLFWFKGGEAPVYMFPMNTDFSHNTLIGTNGVFAKTATTAFAETVTMDFNTWRATDRAEVFTHPSSVPALTLAQWQAASGWDTNSTFTQALPVANTTGILLDDNYTGRGILYAFNYLGSASITFDLTTLLIPDGARCRYYNALNRAEYVDFVYDATSPTLTISMLAASWTRAEPVAHDAPRAWVVEPFPDYGVWQVETMDTADLITVPARNLTATVPARDLIATVPAR